MNICEMASAIISTLQDLIKFNESNEIDSDYADRIKEAYELLVE